MRYFPEHPELGQYRVDWSTRRQLRTLASCSLKRKKVLVAKELNDARYALWLDPLLFHEMCHAVLGTGLKRGQGRTAWHGREFRALERRHPGTQGLQQWIESGGWRRAVRSARAKAFWDSIRSRFQK